VRGAHRECENGSAYKLLAYRIDGLPSSEISISLVSRNEFLALREATLLRDQMDLLFLGV
jgi:hypothetical protein